MYKYCTPINIYVYRVIDVSHILEVWMCQENMSQLSRPGSNQRFGTATASCRGVSEQESTRKDDLQVMIHTILEEI